MSNTTSYELSKQLFEVAKSKGVELPDNSLTWVKYNNLNHPLLDTDPYKWLPSDQGKCYPSYTTDELLDWLPPFTTVFKTSDDYLAGPYISNNTHILKYEDSFNFQGDTPSNALVKLAIYLLENDLLK